VDLYNSWLRGVSGGRWGAGGMPTGSEMEALRVPGMFRCATVTSVTGRWGTGGLTTVRPFLPTTHINWLHPAELLRDASGLSGISQGCTEELGRPDLPIGAFYTFLVHQRGERLGVFGGTFDPPHIGHLVAALEARHALRIDRVLLVVANEPWQKVGSREISPPEDRLAMVAAAVGGVEGLEASDIEIRRGGRSYTVDTLEELAAADPDGERFVVLGADAAGGLATWERSEALPGLATLVLVDRPGMPAPDPPAGWSFVRVVIPRLDVSSTDLRARVVDGRPLEFLTPPAVVSCIRDRQLYRGRP
jgi:nicotinate-nucleotide adenylyltransferase